MPKPNSYRGPLLDESGYWAGVLDGDVDDTLHLLNGALANTNGMDADRIGVHGGSRGAGVSYILAARDARIKLMGLYYGATDHLSPQIKEVIADHLENNTEIQGRDANLAWTVAVEPYQAGALSFTEARHALIRRSAIYFAEDLPRTQFHHGTNDTAVSVEQSRRLVEKRRTIPGSSFEYYEYEGVIHDGMSLTGPATRSAPSGTYEEPNVIAKDEMHEFLCELFMSL